MPVLLSRNALCAWDTWACCFFLLLGSAANAMPCSSDAASTPTSSWFEWSTAAACAADLATLEAEGFDYDNEFGFECLSTSSASTTSGWGLRVTAAPPPGAQAALQPVRLRMEHHGFTMTLARLALVALEGGGLGLGVRTEPRGTCAGGFAMFQQWLSARRRAKGQAQDGAESCPWERAHSQTCQEMCKQCVLDPDLYGFGANGCAAHGGVRACPSTHPYMCNDLNFVGQRRCVISSSTCTQGVRGCDASSGATDSSSAARTAKVADGYSCTIGTLAQYNDFFYFREADCNPTLYTLEGLGISTRGIGCGANTQPYCVTMDQCSSLVPQIIGKMNAMGFPLPPGSPAAATIALAWANTTQGTTTQGNFYTCVGAGAAVVFNEAWLKWIAFVQQQCPWMKEQSNIGRRGCTARADGAAPPSVPAGAATPPPPPPPGQNNYYTAPGGGTILYTTRTTTQRKQHKTTTRATRAPRPSQGQGQNKTDGLSGNGNSGGADGGGSGGTDTQAGGAGSEDKDEDDGGGTIVLVVALVIIVLVLGVGMTVGHYKYTHRKVRFLEHLTHAWRMHATVFVVCLRTLFRLEQERVQPWRNYINKRAL